MSKGRLQQVDIPLKEEVNKQEEDFSDFKEEDLGIQDSEEEVVEIPLEEVEDNKHLLLEEEEVVTITVTRGISSVISAINLGTIALNVKGKLH
jgi:translation elongation factor P/translation initiation factor 5A